MSQPESEGPLESELRTLEAALGALRPVGGRLDRDRLMFLSGQRQAPRSKVGRWAWPAIATSLAVVALSEAVLLSVRPEPRVVERLVVVREAAPARDAGASRRIDGAGGDSGVPAGNVSPEYEGHDFSAPERSESSWSVGTRYARLRREVLQFGLDALPEPPPLALQSAGEVPRPSGELLRSEIDRLLNPGEPS